MIDSHVVELAIEYLDDCIARKLPATLVGMHWYIDARNKTIPLTEEVNAALTQRPALGVERIGGRVVFTHSSEHSVTKEDMRHADRQYRREFARKLKQ